MCFQEHISIMFMFIFLVCIAASSDSTFTIQKFEKNPIAYVEKLGESQIVNGDWNLLVYYDLKNYFNAFNAIRDHVTQIKQKCMQCGFDCAALATQFEHRLSGIQEKNEILMKDRGETRSKREVMTMIGLGGLGVLGGAALYAWLSKPEAEDYAQAIEDLKINQNHMMELIKKQISVFEISYDLDKQNAEKSEKENDSLRNIINALARAEKDGWQLHSIALQCLIMLDNYADIQNRLIDAAMTIQNGNLRPILVSPSKMREQVNLIRSHLGPEFELPKTMANVYQMAKVKVRLIEDKLIFRVAIPVLRKSPFQLLRIIPIPQTSNNISVEILPTTEYLLVNNINEAYYDFTNIEYRACIDIDDKLICRVRHPLYKLSDHTRRCEIELIRNVSSNQKNCRVKPGATNEKWMQLNDIHSWIFALDRERNYNISCEEFSETITLAGVGLLYLNGNCSFTGESVQIAVNQLETRMTTGYFVQTNISSNFNHSIAVYDTPFLRINTKILEAAIQDLKKNDTMEQLDISIHDWHQYGVIYGLVIVAIFSYGLRNKRNRGLQDAISIQLHSNNKQAVV